MNLRLISEFNRTTLIYPKGALGPISPRRDSSLRTSSFVANWPPVQLLTRGVSCAFMPSVPYLFAERLRGSFDGIAMGRLFPRLWIALKTNIPWLVFLLHYAHPSRISSASPDNMQHAEKHLKISADCKFCIQIVPDRKDSKVEKPFIVSSPPRHTARSPFGRATERCT
jgi:hypothetical protein